MGDDAEYYIEQQEEQGRFKQACEYAALDHNRKTLLCWADGVGYEDEIWSWGPLNKILGIFSNIHRARQIGSDCFLACRVPIEGESSLETDNLGEIKFVDGLEFCIANSEADATHEVIILSRDDADLLRGEAVRQESSAKTLKESVCFCKNTMRGIQHCVPSRPLSARTLTPLDFSSSESLQLRSDA